MRPPLLATVTLLVLATQATAQQPVQQTAQQVAQQRDPFQLNAVEQAYLDQVLKTWEIESAKVQTFSCPFTRWEYNAFSPRHDIAFSIDDGQVSYQQPDKGSFQIKTIRRWTPQPVPPGQPPQAAPLGEHVEQPDAIGEHWVCDGKSVYEYKHEQQQVHVNPIPAEMQGKAIVDGPLPFLFGAETQKLKARYQMFIKPSPSPDVIQLVAKPRWQRDAANYRGVELQLDKKTMLPVGMLVVQPGNSRYVYLFHLEQAGVNSRRDRWINALFQAPRIPRGWKRVDIPGQQAVATGLPKRL